MNHLLLYMDDLKVSKKNVKQVDTLVQTVRVVSKDMCIQFDISKCAMLVMRKGSFHNVKAFICMIIDKLKNERKSRGIQVSSCVL